jgi:hypothetical protein
MRRFPGAKPPVLVKMKRTRPAVKELTAARTAAQVKMER